MANLGQVAGQVAPAPAADLGRIASLLLVALLSYYGSKFFDAYQQRLLGTDSPIKDDTVEKITVLRSVIMDPWITEDLSGRPFIETFMRELRATVLDVLKQLQTSGDLPR